MSQEEIGTDLNASKYTKEQFEEFRKLFPEVDTVTLARFLIARDGDVAKATELLKGHLEWKKTNWPPLKSSCLTEFKKGRSYVRGVDKEGHPLIIFHSYLHDPKDRDLEELGRMVVFNMETALSRMPKGKTKTTVLINRMNTTHSADMEFMKHFTKIMQDNYPETSCRTIVYPSGIVFYGIWQIAQLFLDPVTRGKVKPVMYLSGVQEFIDNENIPAICGGSDTYEFNEADYPDPYPAPGVKIIDNGDTEVTQTASTKSE